ncbi:CoA transferase [Eisenibacter elegans]|jgi:crotonobetainyl-CoA:carnitine CoA-transferase CaiB-like acyl-CoA transferase/putative sterol carrier protein|uniref:CoA transferase n=1 Tax=Eisenibacter elegans TaxID=997 RepID=UPI0003FABEEF|nr:CoA transferase [Eisenibacter elegans]
MTTLADIFASLPQRFKADKAGDYAAVFHFEFALADKSTERYTVRIGQGACQVAPDWQGEAACTVRADAQTYIDLTLGKGSPQMAIMTGKVKVSNIPEMLRFAPLFGKFTPISGEAPAPLKGAPTRKPTQGPLQGLRIVDLTRLLPGPLATMLMADMGAEVIKVESPSFKDYTRDFPPYIKGESAAYLAFNRSKRNLALDYSKPEGYQALLELIKTADIFIEQFRPGVLQKMGLAYEDLKAVNPRLIYVSVTGYGHTGPYAQLAGHDLNYIAYAGLLSGNAQSAPQIPTPQIADIAGGSYMAVIACLSALHARQQTGKGQFVDVAMLDGVMPLAINNLMLYTSTGQSPSREQGFLSGGLVNYGIYPTKDEKYVVLGTLEAKFWNKFCEVVARPEWKNRMLPAAPDILAQHKAELTALFTQHPQAYWVDLGLKHDLLITPVYETSELDQDPQVQARQMIISQEHPVAGTIKNIGVPLKFSDTQAAPAWPAPVLGEDSLALMQEIGLSPEQIQALAKAGLLTCQTAER